MNRTIRFKLFLMMVLEFFIWGAWYPLIFGYLPSLGFTPSEQTWILSCFPVAAIVGMFFSNQFADRNFAAEKFLSASHLIAGVAMISLVWTRSFWPFFGAMLVHCLLYVPTISITNSIAFAQMKDAQKEFGIVRMGGTIGWMLAAWPMTFILVDWDKVNAAQTTGFVNWIGTVLGSGLTGPALQAGTKGTFVVAGVGSLLLAAFSLTLPHTPPKPVTSGANKFAWLESLRLLAAPFILVLWLVTFIDATVHNLYFNWTGTFLGSDVAAGGVGIAGNWIMPVMSIGQIAEILTMAVLGVTLKRLGWRTTMICRDSRPRGALRGVRLLSRSQQWLVILINVRARHRLRVLLRDGLHLRRRVLPEGRARQRPGALQPDDSRFRSAGRQRHRAETDGRNLQDRDRRGFQEPVPGAVRHGRRRRGDTAALLPPAAEEPGQGQRQALTLSSSRLLVF